MNFEPVFLPPEKAIGDKISVTFGRAHNACPRAGFLYALHKGGASNHAMQRGSALHRVLQLATDLCVAQGEASPPAEVVKDIVNEVLADPGFAVPLQEHDYIRESAFRWASEVVIDPFGVVSCETLFALDVDGMQVRAKIDLAQLVEDGAAVRVEDYKSSRNLPPYEDIGRKPKRGSDRIAAKDYQLVLYALAVVFGRPVRVEERGGERVEVVEPFGVAERAQRVDLSYVYPGIETSDGFMARRSMDLSITELREYMQSLRAQVAVVRERERSGDWPAVFGSHCVECPAKLECPIPVERRDFAGSINTVEEMREAAEKLAAEKMLHAARRKELIACVKALPGQRLVYGRDQVLEVGYREADTITDKDAMFEAVERAVQFGETFDRSRFVKHSNSTPIVDRRLSEAELEEIENEEGHDGD